MKTNFIIVALLSIILQSGCSQFSGNMRNDLNEDPYSSQPTVGGSWPESQMLSAEDSGGYRQPASEYNENGQSWVQPEDQEANARDEHREIPSYAQNPNYIPPTKMLYKNGARATRDDFVDESQNEGSLWAPGGQTNYYFTKNRIRTPGDIIKIEVEQDLVKNAGTEIKRTLNQSEVDLELDTAQQRLKAKALGLPEPGAEGAAGAAPAARKPASKDKGAAEEDVEVPEATYSDIDVTKNVGLNNGDFVMAEVVERYPNGNYKIRGTKRVPYRNSSRTITLVGIAKAADVEGIENIKSGNLYEYRLQVYR